jgi:dihydroxyacetone kinase
MVLLVNNLGGLSVLELGAITTEVMGQLSHHYDTKPRTCTGTFMASLNGLGCSINSLNVVETHLDVGMVELLHKFCEAAG